MRKRPLLGLLLLVGLMLACDLPMSATATPAVLVPALPTPGREEEVATPIETAVATAQGPGSAVNSPVLLVTATPVIVATPSIPMVTPLSVNVNCRAGPDLAYDSVSVLAVGASTPVAGRTADSSWWYVQDPANPTGFCWVSSSVVAIAGPTTTIPVAALPAAIANQVTVTVTTPPTISCGAPNTVTVSGTISTNGAATVQYQWEIAGAQTNITPLQTLVFTGAGTQNVASPGVYSMGCGSYSVALHVISPNNLSANKAFQITEP